MERQRILIFDTADPLSEKRFQMCRTAIFVAGDRQGKRDRETIRKEARLLDALDGISEPDPRETVKPVCPSCGNPLDGRLAAQLVDTEPRRLIGGRVALSADDHTLLTKYLDTAPWLPASARAARDVQDFADAAEKVDG